MNKLGNGRTKSKKLWKHGKNRKQIYIKKEWKQEKRI
jgi:hypothetical protein